MIATHSAKEVRKALSEYATPATSAGVIIFLVDRVFCIAFSPIILSCCETMSKNYFVFNSKSKYENDIGEISI